MNRLFYNPPAFWGEQREKRKIRGLRLVLDRLSPGRSAADREAAELSIMELDDSDAPSKFDVTGMVISETNVSRGELRAHNARMEQEKRDAFGQQSVPSSAASEADEQAHRGPTGTAVADRRKSVA